MTILTIRMAAAEDCCQTYSDCCGSGMYVPTAVSMLAAVIYAVVVNA